MLKIYQISVWIITRRLFVTLNARENKSTQPLQCYSIPRWPGYLVKAVYFNDWYVISITVPTTVCKSSLAKLRTTAMKIINQLIEIHGTPFKSKTNSSAPHNEKRHHTEFIQLLFWFEDVVDTMMISMKMHSSPWDKRSHLAMASLGV